MARTAVPRVHPLEMPAEDSQPSEAEKPQLSGVPKRYFMWLVAINAVMAMVALLAVVGYGLYSADSWAAMRQQRQQDISTMATEFERLRADVVMTTSENNLFLKIMLLKPGIDKGLARDIAHSVVIRAREHHRDPDLVLAIIDVESNFNPNAVSHMGAVGLMQVMPFWKKSLAIDRDLRDIDTSINYGLKILAMYENTYGSIEMALTVYNRGPNLVNADLKYGRTPFNGYAENIMRAYARIKAWARP